MSRWIKLEINVRDSLGVTWDIFEKTGVNKFSFKINKFGRFGRVARRNIFPFVVLVRITVSNV